MPIPSYSEIVELLKKGFTIEAQEKVMALREATMTLQEENLNLKRELQELKQKMEIETALEYDGKKYTIKEGTRKGDYCPTCYDKDKKLIRLRKLRPNSRGAQDGWTFYCGVCDFTCE